MLHPVLAFRSVREGCSATESKDVVASSGSKGQGKGWAQKFSSAELSQMISEAAKELTFRAEGER